MRQILPGSRTPRGPGEYAGGAELSWPRQANLISRGIGVAFVVAGATALLSLVFPPARDGSPLLAAIVSAVALLSGVCLLGWRSRLGAGAERPSILAFATATVSLGVYAGGAPASGAMFFYLWVIPYAFALLRPAQAAAQAAWMALCYGLVLAIQIREHPEIGSAGELGGLWFIAVVTVLVVGTLVRVLSRSLRDVDRSFHRAFRDSQIGAAFISTDGRWLDVNDALCQTLARARSVLLGTSLIAITAPEDRGSTWDALSTAAADGVKFEKRYLRPDGEVVWVEVAASQITPERGDPYLFAQYRDITAHKRDRDTLAHQAVHDPLTGLYNRTLLLDRLETALGRHEAVAVLLLDLDGFKIVNDSLGHQTGDDVLTAIAPRLLAAIGSKDTLARLGGDEFVVLCEQLLGPLDAIDRANRLAAAVAAPVELATGAYKLTASIGVATSDGQPRTADTMLRDADAAMYRAKAKGRGRIELFDQTMRDEAIIRLQLEHDLQAAIERGQFVLEYQPIVSTDTLYPVALEALIRWDHPHRGRLVPAVFIPLAEETGLITQIGEWVITTACDQLASWQRSPGRRALQLCVNVSPVQLAVDGFVTHVAKTVRRSRISPDSLCLEITESAILADKAPSAALDELKALGVRVLLDDFGTGYASLAYLSRFPIDTLKIDQSFVSALDGTAHSATITKAILAMAHELGIDVVAEGVENETQLRHLLALNCPHVQGRAISYPLAAEDVPAYLGRHLRSLALPRTA